MPNGVLGADGQVADEHLGPGLPQGLGHVAGLLVGYAEGLLVGVVAHVAGHAVEDRPHPNGHAVGG